METRTHRTRRARTALFLLAPLLASSAADLRAQTLQTKAGLSVEQAMSLEQVANPVFGEGFLAWQVVIPRPIDEGSGPARAQIWILEDRKDGEDEPRARMLVDEKAEAHDLAVRPGSRSISYLQTADGSQQLFERSIDGGEERRVASTQAIASYAWRPDGKAFAFTALDPMPQGRARARASGFEPIVFEEDWRPLSLWLWEEGAEPRRLTEKVSIFHVEWSPNGGSLAVAAAMRNLVDDRHMFQRIYTCNLKTGGLVERFDPKGKLRLPRTGCRLPPRCWRAGTSRMLPAGGAGVAGGTPGRSCYGTCS